MTKRDGMTKAQREARRRMIERADSIYYPCDCGIHVCGSNDVTGEAITVANLPTATPDDARRVWSACRVAAEARDGEPEDLCVDLNIDRDNLHVDDFSISRQMLDRCLAAGRAALANAEKT